MYWVSCDIFDSRFADADHVWFRTPHLSFATRSMLCCYAGLCFCNFRSVLLYFATQTQTCALASRHPGRSGSSWAPPTDRHDPACQFDQNGPAVLFVGSSLSVCGNVEWRHDGVGRLGRDRTVEEVGRGSIFVEQELGPAGDQKRPTRSHEKSTPCHSQKRGTNRRRSEVQWCG